MPWAKVLPTSNKRPVQSPSNSQYRDVNVSKTHYGIVVLWLGFTVLAAIYFITDRLVSFDPQQKLANVNHQSLVEQIIAEFELPNHLPNTLINFVGPNCKCNQTSFEHLSDVKNTAKQSKMSVINITIPKEFNGLVPSTPAVMALDNNNELIYFGPYSEGLSCGKGEGIIDLVLSNYKKGFNAQLIMANSEGCYCNT